jgi:hypothetical protein
MFFVRQLFAEDALIADRMNLKCGGKQPPMRDGWYEVGTRGAVVGKALGIAVRGG